MLVLRSGEDCQFSSGEQVLKNLSMSEDNLGRNIGILVCASPS